MPTEVAILILLYLLPTIVAAARRHHQQNAIAVTNLLLGWTVLGWIVALIWASTEVRRRGAA